MHKIESITLFVFILSGNAWAATLYVSTEGRADWSGTLAAPNADHSDGPLPSISAARNAIRNRRFHGQWLDEPVTVWIRGGTYFLDEPLVFEAQDSGTPDKPIIYAAYEKETPIISGGRPLTGWRVSELNGTTCWMLDIPEVRQGQWYFRQLFAADHRCLRTRLPREGFYFFTGTPEPTAGTNSFTGQRQVNYRPGDIRDWRNPNDIDVISLQSWVEARMPIAEVDESRNLVRFMRSSRARLAEPIKKFFSRYYVENVFEALEEPGQWYLDRKTGVLYYLPRPGETPDQTVVIAPRLPRLLTLMGFNDLRNWSVHDLHFQGLTFSHAEWWLPFNMSLPGDQGDWLVPGAIFLQNAKNCRFTACTVKHISSYAFEITFGCEDNLVEDCILTDLGAGGIKIGPQGVRTTAANNEIGPGGLIFHSAVGIWIGDSCHNTVAHNHVHHLYYSGISVGWTWGYGPSKSNHNIVEYNHVHHIGQGWLSDLGGIYTLGISPGTVIRNNLIHDVESAEHDGYGIYNDSGSSEILMENNIVYRTTDAGYHLNNGRDLTIRNNIFAYGKNEDISRGSNQAHFSTLFERNIVYTTLPRVLGGEYMWMDDKYRLDYNLYYREGGQWFDFPGDRDLAQWREWRGQDRNSLIADPLFMDPQNGDFRLKPGSPAEKIGFQPIDAGKIGRSRKP